MSAYFAYNLTMSKCGMMFGLPVASVIGAFCALSPNNDYMGNLRSLVSVAHGYINNVPVEDITVSTYNACKLRAWQCLSGVDFLSFTRGPKTRSFYKNITSPTDNNSVTIDGHMFSVWSGTRFRMKEVAHFKFRYEDIAKDFRTVARQIGILPSQLQAICWFAWKRMNRIVYDAQLNMFSSNDQWGLMPDVARIKPFNRKSHSKE